jgi:iron complex outermembrane receptor protein
MRAGKQKGAVLKHKTTARPPAPRQWYNLAYNLLFPKEEFAQYRPAVLLKQPKSDLDDNMNHPRETRRPAHRLALLVLASIAAQAASAAEDFLDLNLREVLDLEITTASRKPQSVSQAAAAVYVITAEDIRRSPARTLPDLLRTVPGLQVASISSSTWAISARGLNGRFANKLQVLIDGRSVYSPLFAGVYWDAQETALEDIERIEVVRGPGGTLWGANAFHGVINIITRSAASSQGTQLSLTTGDEQRFAAGLKHGGRISDDAHYRFYVKGFDRDASRLTSTGASARDGWRAGSTGARLDFGSEESSAYTLQGDYYYGQAGEPTIVNLLRPPYRAYVPTQTRYEGASVLGRWQQQVGETDSFTLQAFADFTRRDWPAHTEEKRLSWDVDFQYHLSSLPRNDLIMGVGLRLSDDSFAAATRGIPSDALQVVQGQAGSVAQKMVDLFAQDDISLLPERLTLTLGMKVEHLPDTGTELSPNARMLWTPSARWSVWGAVSRAVRTPSRVDRRGQVVAAVEPPSGFSLPQPEVLRGFNQISSPLPVVLQQGSGHVDAERVVAFEAGIKHRFSEKLSLDVAAFRNEYERLRTAQLVPPTCEPGGGIAPACLFTSTPGSVRYLMENSPVGNDTDGYGQGLELSVDWLPTGPLRLQAALTVFKSLTEAGFLTTGKFETDRDSGSPRAQWSLTGWWNAGRAVDATLGLRHVDKVSPAIGIDVAGYTELDARLAWRPRANLELALHGRNLLHDRHQEYASELLETALTSVERSVFGQATLRF